MSVQPEIDALLVKATTEGNYNELQIQLEAGKRPSEDADDLVTIAAGLTDVGRVRYKVLRVLVNNGLPEEELS